ncbi:unnamed protein product [Ceutorhynchus assimilis]|uniref:THAP-type domain-containing protein n=1 Tax=Ceutorhynchus assimilis TaxID=467358 RepID=A0A9N9MME0_9CUCU|nr:unnamed protein product [Ceutorhynchus assimilis]
MSKSCQVCKKLDHHGLDVTYHLIPRDPVRRQIWSALLGFPKEKVLPKYSYICSRHFHKSDFHYKRNGIKYLNADAQPLLVNSNVFEPQQGSDEETESASLSFGGVSSSFKM